MGCYTLHKFAETFLNEVILKPIEHRVVLSRYQKDLLDTLQNNHRGLVLTARQMGKSVLSSIYAVWEAYKDNNKNICIIVPNHFYLVSSEPRLQKGIEYFKIDSHIKLTFNVETLMGYTPDLLIIDEADYQLDDKTIEYISKLPSNTKILMIGSPSRIYQPTHFIELYKKSLSEDTGWTTKKYIWSDNEDRDIKWKQSTIQSIGIDAFNIEMECIID